MPELRETRWVERSSLLAIGFGTTVVMWVIGYVLQLPAAATGGSTVVPGWITFALLLLCMVAGGFVAGKRTSGGWRAGVAVGALSATVNLLILGSVMGSRLHGQGISWIPLWLCVGSIVGGLGGLIGARARVEGGETRNWTQLFAAVASAATFMLLIVGGVVTSERAGLAVVDWPNTFGHNMFLYPISRMTGGIYFEHAHRLFGSLVGLTTLVLAAHLYWIRERPWLKRFALGALAIVIVQGLLGGLRVTGHLTMSASRSDTAPNIVLAVVHGVLAQAFFAMMISMVAFTSTPWMKAEERYGRGRLNTDAKLGLITSVLVLAQIVLGALQRHLARGLLIHTSLAVVVAFMLVACAARAWGLHDSDPVCRRLGKAIVIATVLQLLLGFGAMVVTGALSGPAQPPPVRVTVTTAHQAVGAFLLAHIVLLTLWSYRLLRDRE